MNAANYRDLQLIPEFDRRAGWSDVRLPSCAHRLNFKVGLTIGAAREQAPGRCHIEHGPGRYLVA